MDAEKLIVWGVALWVLWEAWQERDTSAQDLLPGDTSRDPCALPDPQFE